MAKRTWKDTDLSAYVDGELDPETTQALEAHLSEDPALQRRLDAFTEVSNLVRAVPMREPPRNYLLTEAMVAEPEPEAQARRVGLRLPLWAMRLATSLTAAAFVVTLSFSLFQQGLSPSAMMESADSQPQREMMRLESEATPTVEIQALQVEESAPVEEPVEEEEVAAEILPTPTPQATLTAKEEMALKEMPAAPEGGGQGVGGGSEPPTAAEALPEDASAESPQDEADEEAEVEAADVAIPSPTPEAGQPEIATEEAPDVNVTPEAFIGEESEEFVPPPLPPVETPDRLLGPNRWRWLAAATGALTAILGGLTIWMSRRRR